MHRVASRLCERELQHYRRTKIPGLPAQITHTGPRANSAFVTAAHHLQNSLKKTGRANTVARKKSRHHTFQRLSCVCVCTPSLFRMNTCQLPQLSIFLSYKTGRARRFLRPLVREACFNFDTLSRMRVHSLHPLLPAHSHQHPITLSITAPLSLGDCT